jgi:aryl-alcohol dehydrogenase-like predicted oxidoreductase
MLNVIAREIGATPIQLVLAWMLRSSPVVLPLVSANTREQLDEQLGALDLALDNGQIKRLDEAGASTA